MNWQVAIVNKDKKKIIVGMGKSGISSAKFLLKKGFKIAVFDSAPEKIMANEDIKDILRISGAEGIYGENAGDEVFEDSDLVVLSPGVPLDNEIVKRAKAHGLKIIGEVELAYMYSKGKFLGITGTNGKTTTTTLVHEIFKNSDIQPFLGGNIGNPIVDFIEDVKEKDYVIAELSSFQLETIENFRAEIAVILNITPDHIDRHKTMESYIDAKKNIYKNSMSEDILVLNKDDEVVCKMAEDARCKVVFFSLEERLDEGAYLKDGSLVVSKGGSTFHIIHKNDLKIPGMHNVENALAASAAAFYAGIDPKLIGKVLMEFKGVEHRLEFVRNIDGVDYYNDSKGTNTDAGIIALKAIDAPVILIAGGYDKKADFSDWIDKFKQKAKKVFLIGETADQIMSQALESGYDSVEKCVDLKEAVEKARESARQGDAVLLSPACASWDMFKSYEERGQIFKELVNSL
ncbi:MAG TPA: UDP-N-acetylmuramoyl-L-alanine--D-glutamate ligase [Eubacteriaceae bacterium]|jgi:UDP-N-acetylmuramoylalanine--D-glutamate ligase|nr:UDP-N-acetylmuramoyl-L-alanine--D-glutamate ligase [Eubacteriaceae bacterium]